MPTDTRSVTCEGTFPLVDPENRNRKSNPLNCDFVYLELATRGRLEEFFSNELSDRIFLFYSHSLLGRDIPQCVDYITLFVCDSCVMSCLITTCNISLFKDLFALIRDISKEIRKPGSLEKFSLYFTSRRRSSTSCFLLSWFQFSFSSIRFRSLILWLHRTYYCCARNLCFSVCPVSVVYPGFWAPQLTLKRREAVFQVFYTFTFMFAWFFRFLSAPRLCVAVCQTPCGSFYG